MRMDKVKCYRCGRAMRWIARLKIYFCDNDGFILGPRDAAVNGLLEAEGSADAETH